MAKDHLQPSDPNKKDQESAKIIQALQLNDPQISDLLQRYESSFDDTNPRFFGAYKGRGIDIKVNRREPDWTRNRRGEFFTLGFEQSIDLGNRGLLNLGYLKSKENITHAKPKYIVDANYEMDLNLYSYFDHGFVYCRFSTDPTSEDQGNLTNFFLTLNPRGLATVINIPIVKQQLSTSSEDFCDFIYPCLEIPQKEDWQAYREILEKMHNPMMFKYTLDEEEEENWFSIPIERETLQAQFGDSLPQVSFDNGIFQFTQFGEDPFTLKMPADGEDYMPIAQSLKCERPIISFDLS